MSDRVVVMDHGLVEQIGAPEDVYRWPASRFVANFLGQSNILPGTVEAPTGAAAIVRLANGAALNVANGAGATRRARRSRSSSAPIACSSARRAPGGANVFAGTVAEPRLSGRHCRLFHRCRRSAFPGHQRHRPEHVSRGRSRSASPSAGGLRAARRGRPADRRLRDTSLYARMAMTFKEYIAGMKAGDFPLGHSS